MMTTLWRLALLSAQIYTYLSSELSQFNPTRQPSEYYNSTPTPTPFSSNFYYTQTQIKKTESLQFAIRYVLRCSLVTLRKISGQRIRRTILTLGTRRIITQTIIDLVPNTLTLLLEHVIPRLTRITRGLTPVKGAIWRLVGLFHGTTPLVDQVKLLRTFDTCPLVRVLNTVLNRVFHAPVVVPEIGVLQIAKQAFSFGRALEAAVAALSVVDCCWRAGGRAGVR